MSLDVLNDFDFLVSKYIAWKKIGLMRPDFCVGFWKKASSDTIVVCALSHLRFQKKGAYFN